MPEDPPLHTSPVGMPLLCFPDDTLQGHIILCHKAGKTTPASPSKAAAPPFFLQLPCKTLLPLPFRAGSFLSLKKPPFHEADPVFSVCCL